MSVQTEIDRIITAVGAAYDAVETKGGTLPASETVANLAEAISSIPKPSAPYVLPQATADALGGIKADAKTETDTVPARIDANGKLWVKVPDAPLIVAATEGENNTVTTDYSSSEILAAVSAGREVYLRTSVGALALVLAFGGAFQGKPFFYNFYTTGLAVGAALAVVDGNQVDTYNPDFLTSDDISVIKAQLAPQLLPEVTAEDNGKFARVVNGAWAAQALTNVSEVGA